MTTSAYSPKDRLIGERATDDAGKPGFYPKVISVDSSGAPVSSGGVDSPENTSTTPLDSGATFTGTGVLNSLPDVIVSCKSDVAGTLFFDFSNDGTNWDTFPVGGFAVAAGIHEFHTAVKGPRYFRVRLVNGSAAQAYLRLYTYFATTRQGNLPANQSIGADADAIVVRSIDSNIDLELGRFGGMQARNKFGYSDGLGTAIQAGTPTTWVDIWFYGGQRTTPSGTFTPFMASSSASDTGDIAWTYLDAAGAEQSVTVTLTGQTPVSLGVTAQEVYRGKLATPTALVGTVYCTTANNYTSGVPDAAGEVLASINPTDGQTQILAFRTPAGTKTVLRHCFIELARDNGSAGSSYVALDIRESGGPWLTKRLFTPTSSVPINNVISGLTLPGLTDVRFRIRDVSDTATIITGSLNYDIVDDA